MTDNRATRTGHPSDVHCPQCRKLIFDAVNQLLLSRVTRFRADGAYATCKVCKREVKVPVQIVPPLLALARS